MNYFKWKREFFKKDSFCTPDYEWLYNPYTQGVRCFEVTTGLVSTIMEELFEECCRNNYLVSSKPLTIDQKLDKILALLEK